MEHGGDPQVSTCDLNTLETIHENLQHTVLVDEHGHIPRPVTAPNPHEFKDPANTDFWLESIASGTWPVMYLYNEAGELQPLQHDQADYHLGLMALYPRELQDILSEVARLELERRHNHPDHQSEPAIPDEAQDDKDPYNAGTRGNESYKNAVVTIDEVTDFQSYLSTLSTLISEPEPGKAQEFYTALLDQQPDPYDYSPVAEAARGLKNAARQMVYLANCHMRLTKNRNLEPHEAEAAYADFTQGVLRVVLKLRGEWQDPPRSKSN